MDKESAKYIFRRGGAPEPLLFDYGEALDFKTLWTDGGGAAIAGGDHGSPIVIWWEQRTFHSEHGAKLLRSHLTPLDWALSWSLARARANKSLPSILVVAYLDSSLEQSWSISFRHTLLALMPWVKIGYGIDPGGLPKKAFERGKTLPHVPDLEEMHSAWKASLSVSSEYHDVNNILGARLLAPERDGAAAWDVRPLSMALRQRVEWCDAAFSKPLRLNQWKYNRERLFDKKLKVIAVDDMLDDGWDAVIAGLFGLELVAPAAASALELTLMTVADGDVVLHGATNPSALIAFLEENATQFEERQFSTQIVQSEETQPELILLDLRLFSSADFEVKKKAARTLLGIADRLTTNVANLAWKAISQDELTKIHAWVEGATVEDPQHVETQALLLLPRLLALALPLTPIILFSSTGQARIKEWLKPYRNIITGFEKPRTLSDPAALAESEAALHDALERSVPMMRLRLQLAHAQRAITLAEKSRPANDVRLKSNEHIEIFADERQSGSTIISGLAMCVFPGGSHANALQRTFEQQFKDPSGGVVWAQSAADRVRLSKGNHLTPPGLHDKFKEKRNNEVESVSRLISQEVSSNSRALWSAVATQSAPNQNTVASASLAAFPDKNLDRVLRFGIEFTLFSLIPYFSNNKKFSGTIDIYIPTRIVTKDTIEERLAVEISQSFDIPVKREKTKDNDNAYVGLLTFSLKGAGGDQTLGSAFPLVRGWLEEWSNSMGIIAPLNIKKIKMSNLTSKVSDSNVHSRRLLHDIADWVCAASERPFFRNDLRRGNLLNQWFVSTYNYPDDFENAIVLVHALRELNKIKLSGTYFDVLHIIMMHSYLRHLDKRIFADSCASHRVILWSLRDALQHSTGHDLHGLVAIDSTFSPL